MRSAFVVYKGYVISRKQLYHFTTEYVVSELEAFIRKSPVSKEPSAVHLAESRKAFIFVVFHYEIRGITIRIIKVIGTSISNGAQSRGCANQYN